MMKYILFFLLPSLCFGQSVEHIKVPVEVWQETHQVADDEIKDKQWNRWTSKSFVVCSLDNEQGKFLRENLEKVKQWSYTRWGLADVNFTSEARLICVDDARLYKKLFGIDTSKVEIRRENERIKLSVAFLLLNDKPAKTLPQPLTEICLAEYEQTNNAKLPWALHRGMALLNCHLSDIRQWLKDLHPMMQADQPMYFSKGLWTTTEQEYDKLSLEQRNLYDRCAMAFCLMLRKEFGQTNFLKFMNMSGTNPELALKNVYGFSDYNHSDVSFKRYMVDLTSDIVRDGVTPDSYLQIRCAKD